MAVAMASDQQLFEPKQGSDITYEDMVDEREALGESQIQKLFTGTTVLVTGGTGFVGKLLVEKLLRSCPNLKRIYLLGRPKKNKDIAKRLEEQFNDVLYDRLRKEQPDFTKKVTIVEGDVGFINLAMKDEDRKRLISEVEIIFHGAATVRFDEALKKAVEVNVRGTREMLLLARACTKLRAMVHVSTAYSNCILREIEEKIYDTALPAEKLIDLVENLDEKIMEKITPGLIGEYPNTYAYTKSVAEDIVRKYSKGLPVVLFRPAIMIATAKEPVAGWIDNIYGPTGVVLGAGLGLLHVLKCNPSAVADMVPGDMVINAMIAAAWKVVRDSPGNHEDAPPAELPPPVYNYVSSVQKPLTWQRFMSLLEKGGFEVPSHHTVWHYLFVLTPSTFFFNFMCFFTHWIPAYAIDAVASLIGKEPMLKKAYTKIDKFSEVISYFALREWKFKNDNVQRLFNEMSDADKNVFDFDIGSLDWNDYAHNYVRGIRVYLVKDPMDTLDMGRRHYQKLKLMHYTCCAILGLVLFMSIWGVFGWLFLNLSR